MSEPSNPASCYFSVAIAAHLTIAVESVLLLSGQSNSYTVKANDFLLLAVVQLERKLGAHPHIPKADLELWQAFALTSALVLPESRPNRS